MMALCVAGLLLLKNANVRVLGGTVPELYEAWDVERKYGALAGAR